MRGDGPRIILQTPPDVTDLVEQRCQLTLSRQGVGACSEFSLQARGFVIQHQGVALPAGLAIEFGNSVEADDQILLSCLVLGLVSCQLAVVLERI